MRRCRLAAVVIVVAFLAGPSRPALADRNVVRTPGFSPKVFRYDPDTDKFYHFRSVTNPIFRRRSGGEISYYGNRLTQYRYLGPREQSGIYGALDDYKSRMKLDPSNYKYHW